MSTNVLLIINFAVSMTVLGISLWFSKVMADKNDNKIDVLSIKFVQENEMRVSEIAQLYHLVVAIARISFIEEEVLKEACNEKKQNAEYARKVVQPEKSQKESKS